MKTSRHALALAALCSLGGSGAALAQSSVTLYGAVDAGVGRVTPGTAASGNFANIDANRQTQFLGSSLMNNTGSRLGLRGVEDLGGGIKAGFWLESLINMNNGDAGFGPSLWNREANLWLSSPWGTLTLGRDLRPSAWAVIAYDLTTAANYSVVANTFFFPGKGPRASSMIAYKTPSFNGLTASLAHVLKNDNVVAGTGQALWDANLVYAAGPLTAVAGASKQKDSRTNHIVGAKYRWSSFALGATHMSAHHASNGARRSVSLGGTYFQGPFSVTLDLTRDMKNEWAGKRYTNGVLDMRYALSKRTFVYAAYLRFDGTSNYGLGVRHNF